MNPTSRLNNGFRFNLLPRKTLAEIKLVDQRDNSLLYATGILFLSSIIWFTTSIILQGPVRGTIAEIGQSIQGEVQKSDNLSTVQEGFGELFLRSKMLSPLVQKRVDTERIFEIAAALTDGATSAEVISYQRDLEGKYVFRIAGGDYSAVNTVIKNARKLQAVSDIELRGSVQDETGIVISTVALKVNGSN